jgi:pentatricopeptide repeat protein
VNGVVIRPPETRQLERWNRAIDAAARQNGAAQAGKLLLDFEAEGNGKACCSPDAVSYNLVIRAFAKQGDLKGAEHWLARMEEKRIKATPCSYNTMLDACAKTDNAEACEAWLQKMLDKGVAPSVISYSTAIYARARRGDELMAEAWFARMTAAGIEPDAVCYNSMIHACSVSGNAAGAERWILEMQAQGIEATVTTFSAVIGACAKALDVSRAETWLDAMITAGVQPNVVTFSTMIDACAKACDPSTAEYWHQRMTECGIEPNAHSYSAIINACAKTGDAIKAEQWLCEAERARVADVVLYSSAIDACGKAGDAERAMKVFRRMQTQGVRPHIVAYAALARPFSHRGDWMTVEKIAEEMVSCGIVPNDYFIYAQLLSYAIAEPRQPAKAENCFRNALSSGMKVNDHVLGALARAVGRQSCNSLTRELCQGQTMRGRTRRQHWSS